MIESDRCSRVLTIVYENAINRLFTFTLMYILKIIYRLGVNVNNSLYTTHTPQINETFVIKDKTVKDLYQKQTIPRKAVWHTCGWNKKLGIEFENSLLTQTERQLYLCILKVSHRLGAKANDSLYTTSTILKSIKHLL